MAEIMFPKPKRNKQKIPPAGSGLCPLCHQWGCRDNHHIKSKGSGGGDEPENIIKVCHECHMKIHAGNISKEQVKEAQHELNRNENARME